MIVEFVIGYIVAGAVFCGALMGVDSTERECGHQGIPPLRIVGVSLVWAPALVVMLTQWIVAWYCRRQPDYIARRLDKADREDARRKRV